MNSPAMRKLVASWFDDFSLIIGQTSIVERGRDLVDLNVSSVFAGGSVVVHVTNGASFTFHENSYVTQGCVDQVLMLDTLN